MGNKYVATIGFFDGVHRGHQHLLKQVLEVAHTHNLSAMVITFAQQPRHVVSHETDRFCLLTTTQEKLRLLHQAGIDHCEVMEFTPELASLSAYTFMQLLHSNYQVVTLVIGYDHRFGHNRSEGFDDYVRYGQTLGIEVIQATEFPAVSSSRIRQLLLAGDLEPANEILGHYYQLEGKVVSGFHVGQTMGFPTANLQVATEKLIPDNGVYAVLVELEGTTYQGMLNIGTRPTMANGDERSIEVHIFDFHEDIYNKELRLSLVKRTRGEVKFASKEQLALQLQQDATEIKAILDNNKIV
ncbi:MAG: bifunctional riboflavin kinase/FAD synthetase [Bacteroidaceae bacterium]|nr:bifunctional riboflavin kinase/FAD synthetase [Bacteroidaceae bacterium]